MKNLKFIALLCGMFALMATFFTSCVEEDYKSNAKQITSFVIQGTPDVTATINETTKTIALAMPFGTNVTALVPIITVSPEANVSPASGIAQNFTNPVQYIVTAADGSTASYMVTVTIGGAHTIELTSPITVNTTLKDLGLPVDYVFSGYSLEVKNYAVLTIEPGVTIQFTRTDKTGGLAIKDGATIKAIGSADKHIQFIGVGAEKGAWGNMQIFTNSANQIEYCDFINGGTNKTNYGQGVVALHGGRLSMKNCNIMGSNKYGFYTADMSSSFILDAFDHNTITGCNEAPIYLYSAEMAGKFDLTSTLTGNAKDYIQIDRFGATNTSLNETTVPYYCAGIWGVDKIFTINEGVVLYMSTDACWREEGTGKIVINGTQAKPVKFTRLPNMTYYWGTGSAYSGALQFLKDNGSTLNWCVFEYAKKDIGAIYVNGNARITLNNVTFRENQGYGVFLAPNAGSSITHTGTNERFSNNQQGNVRLPNGSVGAKLP